jgi:hypothetical protein
LNNTEAADYLAKRLEAIATVLEKGWQASIEDIAHGQAYCGAAAVARESPSAM